MHTKLCLDQVQCKKEFKKLDEDLLNYGEELTETIKKIAHSLYFIFLIIATGKLNLLQRKREGACS